MKGLWPKEARVPSASSDVVSPFFVRPMSGGDLEAVAGIEAENTSPWSLGQLTSEQAQESGWQFVAESSASGQVCGFVCGRSWVGEAELLKIAVGREYRRRGIAAQLVAHVLHCLAEQGVGRCFLELRAANLPALALYERFGFHRAGLRKGYYVSPSEDAILMEKIVFSAQL